MSDDPGANHRPPPGEQVVLLLLGGIIVVPPVLLAGIGKQPLRLLALFGLIIFVRGLPSMLLFSGLFPLVEKPQLASLCATNLPLLVAATLGVGDGRMLPANAAALVGAGMPSLAACTFIGIRVIHTRATKDHEPQRNSATVSSP
jgi:hypothetical protein